MNGRINSRNRRIADSMGLEEFRYSDLSILYPQDYHLHLREIFILDVYQSHLLKSNDTVLDLGSATGDFCILASKKVGPQGTVIAIEPNPDDYEILEKNIRRNRCSNITPLNIGISGARGESEITFRERTFKFVSDTLLNVIQNNCKTIQADFIKMDIEGFEYETIKGSMELFEKCRVVSLEFHGTKQLIDDLLLPMGFTYYDVTTQYLRKKVVENLVLHPVHFLRMALTATRTNPRLFYEIPLGHDLEVKQPGVFMGYYIK